MAYTGPGDLKTYKVWAGLRGYSAAYAAPGNNPCFDLYVSGSLVGTINILSTGLVDVATAVSLIGGGTGRIGKLYDQTGGANHFIQTTDLQRPIFVAPNVTGLFAGRPAIQITVAGSELMSGTSNIPATTQPWTMTHFTIRTAGIPSDELLSMQDASSVDLYLGTHASNTAEFSAGTPVTASETDNVWHSLVGVANGASSIIGVDGASTTGLNAGARVPDGAHKLNINNSASFEGKITQVGYAEGGFSTSDITALNTNDQFWFTTQNVARMGMAYL